MEQTPTTPQPTEPPPPPPPQTPQTPTATTSTPTSSSPSPLPPPTTTASFPNPIPAPKPPTTSQSQQPNSSQARSVFNTRPWQATPYSHFALPSPPLPASSASTSSSISAPPPPRGGMAIGVPAHNASAPPPPPASFSSLAPPSYGQQSMIRQPMQTIGMTGALGMTSSMRPTGVPPNQLRPSQSSLRPQTGSGGQAPSPQNFQGHSMFRASSLGTPGSPSPSSSQGTPSQNQPWLSSGTQGKPPLPSPSLRPQTSPQSFQQRSQNPQQQHHHNIPTTQQQQTLSSSQPSSQPLASGQAQDHFNQQFPAARIQQSITHQQQINRVAGLGTQRPPLGMAQAVTSLPGAPSKTATADTEEPTNRILTKRSIQELVNQIDPSEKLDPVVEDILVDIAEDFVESITTFGCSLAKHRKSATLEAKDILLHLERNWNMSLPGFGGDEIRTYKKPIVSEVHKERLAAVRKSILATDKNSSGPSGGGTKGHLAKGPANTIGSPPNPKIREAA